MSGPPRKRTSRKPWQHEPRDTFAPNQAQRDLREANARIEDLLDHNHELKQTLHKRDAKISMLEDELEKAKNAEIESKVKFRTLELTSDGKENPYKIALNNYLTNIRAGYRLASVTNKQLFHNLGIDSAWEEVVDMTADEYFLGMYGTKYDIANHIMDWPRMKPSGSPFATNCDDGHLKRPAPVASQGPNPAMGGETNRASTSKSSTTPGPNPPAANTPTSNEISTSNTMANATPAASNNVIFSTAKQGHSKQVTVSEAGMGSESEVEGQSMDTFLS